MRHLGDREIMPWLRYLLRHSISHLCFLAIHYEANKGDLPIYPNKEQKRGGTALKNSNTHVHTHTHTFSHTLAPILSLPRLRLS